MSNLLQNVHFLKHFPPAVFVFHIALVNCLNRHVFTGQLVDAQSNFPKCTLADEFDKLIVV